MPNRIIREGINDSERLNDCTPDEEVLFYRLLVVADDFGRLDARPTLIKARCFPLKNHTPEKIQGWLVGLHEKRLLRLYTVGDKSFIQLDKWQQRVRANASKFPEPPPDDGQLSVIGPSSVKHRGNGHGHKKAPQTLKGTRMDLEVLPQPWILFCATARPELDPAATFEQFRDYWIAKPGSAGRKLDWAATWRNWVRQTTAKKGAAPKVDPFEGAT